jgi:hypothetical protein
MAPHPGTAEDPRQRERRFVCYDRPIGLQDAIGVVLAAGNRAALSAGTSFGHWAS